MKTVASAVCLLCLPLSLFVQNNATVRDNAPISVNNNPGPSLAALRGAAVGTVLRVIGQRRVDTERDPSELRPVASIPFEFNIA